MAEGTACHFHIPRSLICIPTYNEADNIAPIIQEVFKNSPGNAEIIVLDDGSPDGTAEIVEKLKAHYPRLNLMRRTKKEGLAAAYLAGFRWGLENGFEWIFEMDADFSHNPAHLQEFFKVIMNAKSNGVKYDGVLGSRYVKGGGVSNWDRSRLLLSMGGSVYSRMILRQSLRDWTGGFNAWSRELLEAIDLNEVRSKGYTFQIELKYRSLMRGFHLKEIPIIFEERRAGQSKMSGSIIKEAIGGVILLKIREHQ